MYRITNINTGASLGAVDKVTYIKIGESGDFTTATESDAIGVALNSIAYNLTGHEEIEGADTVVVSEFDGGALVAEQQKNHRQPAHQFIGGLKHERETEESVWKWGALPYSASVGSF